MIPFTEAMRYEFPTLTPADVVMDVGGYEGNWSKTVVEKYGCRAVCFEPAREFYKNICVRFSRPPLSNLIRVENYGLAESTRAEMFGIRGDSTGLFAHSANNESVTLRAIDNVMAEHDWLAGRDVAVLKINAEGAEFEILERLLDCELTKRFGVIQVQPHNVVTNAADRWAVIKARMSFTHDIVFDEPWCWVGWEARK